ncbi:MAG: histidine triad nucleotide-binding protein [Gammaproteobacteria bacterium]|nr:histidine triad nucleotide-binding protein [Gammaproteobacteria bacterium]
MSDCIFCKIINGDIPADILYQDNDVLAFRDLSPQAPVHFLVIPKKHISTINDFQDDDAALIGKLYLAAKMLAKQEQMHESGYRCVMNCNDDGGQTVHHIHLHVLGKRQMTWPPG